MIQVSPAPEVCVLNYSAVLSTEATQNDTFFRTDLLGH